MGRGILIYNGIGLGIGGVWGGKDLGKRVSRFWKVGRFGGKEKGKVLGKEVGFGEGSRFEDGAGV